MKIAVLSDIHGNLEAFEAVHADLSKKGVDRVICLGDNIGYGPNPEEVVARIRQLGYASVLGNHEFALMDERGRRWFNFQAAENNVATEKILSEQSKDYCRRLPAFIEFGKAYFVHGYPPASVFRYLDRQQDDRLAALFDSLPAALFFLGHTHKLELVTGQKDLIIRRALIQEVVMFEPGEKYIINCGSVGQPRDGDNRAKYIVWDCGNHQIRGTHGRI